MGIEDVSKIDMSSINFEFSKTSLLFIEPKLPEEFFFCQDSVKKVLEEYNVKFKATKSSGKYLNNEFQSILPLARSRDLELFKASVAASQEEFIMPFQLATSSIVLFEKTSSGWIQKRRLFDFPKCELNLNASNINVSGFQLS